MKRIIAVMVLAVFLSGCSEMPAADAVLKDIGVAQAGRALSNGETCRASCTNIGYGHWGLLNENGKLACECTGEKCVDEEQEKAILRICTALPVKRFYFG